MPETTHSAGLSSSVAAGIGLCLALLFGLAPLATWISPGHRPMNLVLHEATFWMTAVILLLWLRYAEKLPLSSIGLRRPTGKTFGYGLLAGLVLILIFIVHFAVIVRVFHLSAAQSGAQRNVILSHSLGYRILLVLRAAVVEEIVFRGYLIEKVRQLSGSATLAVAVSLAVFTYAHLSSWGAVHLIPVFAAGVIFALLYVWRRDLPCNMIAHFIADGVAFIFG